MDIDKIIKYYEGFFGERGDEWRDYARSRYEISLNRNKYVDKYVEIQFDKDIKYGTIDLLWYWFFDWGKLDYSAWWVHNDGIKVEFAFLDQPPLLILSLVENVFGESIYGTDKKFTTELEKDRKDLFDVLEKSYLKLKLKVIWENRTLLFVHDTFTDKGMEVLLKYDLTDYFILKSVYGYYVCKKEDLERKDKGNAPVGAVSYKTYVYKNGKLIPYCDQCPYLPTCLRESGGRVCYFALNASVFPVRKKAFVGPLKMLVKKVIEDI